MSVVEEGTALLRVSSTPSGTMETSMSMYFVYLKGRNVLMARMHNRKGYFMKAGVLESQLNALENLKTNLGGWLCRWTGTFVIDIATTDTYYVACEPTPTLRMDHGGHDMLPRCSMHMLWNTQIIDTCVVFPSWHIRSSAQFVFSFAAIVCLSVLYEYLRLFQRDVDARIRERVNKGKRAASPPVSGRSTPSEHGEDTGLLNGRKARSG